MRYLCEKYAASPCIRSRTRLARRPMPVTSLDPKSVRPSSNERRSLARTLSRISDRFVFLTGVPISSIPAHHLARYRLQDGPLYPVGQEREPVYRGLDDLHGPGFGLVDRVRRQHRLDP